MDRKTTYNAAVQFYNQEIKTLGDRTQAFLIVQSILVAALVALFAYQENFPIAFDFFAFGFILAGILYCLLQSQAGMSGAQAAFRWRQYMFDIENNQRDAPWNSIYEHCPHTCRGRGMRRLCTQLTCEGCLLERPPLPSAWLISPSIFIVLWSGASLYLIISYIFAKRIGESCYHLTPVWLFIIFALVALGFLSFTIYTIIRNFNDWRNQARIRQANPPTRRAR
jgi:hypothetical protein